MSEQALEFAARARRFDELLAPLELHFVGTDGDAGLLWDIDGNELLQLSGAFLAVLEQLADTDLRTVFGELADLREHTHARAYAEGLMAGHTRLVRQVHELLGIERLVVELQRP